MVKYRKKSGYKYNKLHFNGSVAKVKMLRQLVNISMNLDDKLTYILLLKMSQYKMRITSLQ